MAGPEPRLFRRGDGRYYALYPPAPDLLGDPVIVAIRGSIHSRQGGVHTWPAADMNVHTLVRLRLKHGYRETPPERTDPDKTGSRPRSAPGCEQIRDVQS